MLQERILELKEELSLRSKSACISHSKVGDVGLTLDPFNITNKSMRNIWFRQRSGSVSSSGFFSGAGDTESRELSRQSSRENMQQLVRLEGEERIKEKNVGELKAEAERLSCLVDVLEEREEQLNRELELAQKGGSVNKVGEGIKKALLLTAAFGAVHSALQKDLVMGCTWM